MLQLCFAAAGFGGWSISELAIAIIVIAGFIAIVCIALKAMGLSLPDWAVKCLIVVAIVFVAIFCIKLISMM